LEDEHKRQNENDQLRKQFAQAANAFHSWLTATRYVVFSYVDPKSHVRYCHHFASVIASVINLSHFDLLQN
jgi:hypothetical protein